MIQVQVHLIFPTTEPQIFQNQLFNEYDERTSGEQTQKEIPLETTQ